MRSSRGPSTGRGALTSEKTFIVRVGLLSAAIRAARYPGVSQISIKPGVARTLEVRVSGSKSAIAAVAANFVTQAAWK